MRWRSIDYLAAAVIFLGAVALIVLVGITGWQVWGRYVLNDTPTWAERLALLLILVVSLPIAAVGLREEFHLGISFLLEMLPPRGQRVLKIINAMILWLFGLAMAWHSWTLVAGTWNRNIPLLGVPQAFQYLPLVLCGGLIVLFMTERLYFLLRGAPPRNNKD
ncbi:MAG: TRAP transporter small permease [Pararhodobacter sp.]